MIAISSAFRDKTYHFANVCHGTRQHDSVQERLEPAHEEKEHFLFPVCGSSSAHEQSTIWAREMHFCLKLPQGHFYMSVEKKRLWWDCAYAQARLTLSWSLM